MFWERGGCGQAIQEQVWEGCFGTTFLVLLRRAETWVEEGEVVEVVVMEMGVGEREKTEREKGAEGRE